MPPELLSIIFENCLPAKVLSSATLSESPLLFGRVCTHWRSVSQSTPKLWTSLSFNFLESDIDRVRDGIKVTFALDTWLRRSSNLLLSVSFTDNRIYQPDTEDLIAWFLLQIREHSKRWKYIYLQFSSDYFTRLSVVSSCKFTSLESLSIHADHMGWRRGLATLSLDLILADRLKSLSYTGPDWIIREDIFVDWTRLTEISFQYNLHEAGGESSTLFRHFATLGICQNLAVLSIGIGYSFRSLPNDFIVLPHLHTLKIRRLSRNSRGHVVFNLFILPQLETLEIDGAILVGWDGFDTQWHDSHFSEMLRRSACTLQGLHIRDVDFPNEELVRCLALAPALASFVFLPCPRFQPISDLIDYLSIGSIGNETPAAPSPRLPRLEKLRLGCANEAYFTPLAEMVESRSRAGAARAGVARLLEFELVLYDFIHDDDPLRKVHLSNFKERLMRCADDDGRMVVGVRVDRPYDPVYIPIPSDV
ncbi:hypothetical protein PAXINDRAFT_135501 [Paxillus involutus ATCC 200175]|uniref:F-box domain-containing protein n=1 Tax=Paxillus involutus ATCC 200175 TaxID=664439 RepID=A0A0C9U3L3_PAXIN|nr:hypothetical protein PAXINDRAFT_135501 [Paxillus involutus ATCC 200175]